MQKLKDPSRAFNDLLHVIDTMGNAGDYFSVSNGIYATTQRFVIGTLGYAGSSGKVVFGKAN
jgi:hypothetical protein